MIFFCRTRFLLTCPRAAKGKCERTSFNLPWFAPCWKEQSSSYVQNPKTPRQQSPVGRARRLKSTKVCAFALFHAHFAKRYMWSSAHVPFFDFLTLPWFFARAEQKISVTLLELCITWHMAKNCLPLTSIFAWQTAKGCISKQVMWDVCTLQWVSTSYGLAQ